MAHFKLKKELHKGKYEKWDSPESGDRNFKEFTRRSKVLDKASVAEEDRVTRRPGNLRTEYGRGSKERIEEGRAKKELIARKMK